MPLPSSINVLRWPVAWLGMLGLYLSLAARLGVREWVAGIVIASLATAATCRLVRCGNLRLAVRWRDALPAWRMPWYMVFGTGEVIVALTRQLFTPQGAASLTATAPFRLGDRVDRDEAGRRALAVFYTTATPNFVVLGLLDEQDAMLYHQVKPGPVLAMTRTLGGGPGPNG